MSHDLPFYDIIACFDISSISVGHMICLYKPSDITYLVTYFDYVIFPVLVDHMTCGHVTGHVTFPTLHLVYILQGLGSALCLFPPSPAGKCSSYLLLYS